MAIASQTKWLVKFKLLYPQDERKGCTTTNMNAGGADGTNEVTSSAASSSEAGDPRQNKAVRFIRRNM